MTELVEDGPGGNIYPVVTYTYTEGVRPLSRPVPSHLLTMRSTAITIGEEERHPLDEARILPPSAYTNPGVKGFGMELLTPNEIRRGALGMMFTAEGSR